MTLSIPPLTDAEKQALIDAAIKDEKKRKQEGKRRRENAELNSDEAIGQRTDFDPFTGD
jgi:hypothetical protein